jgi:phenylpropionate dioxygenase-like ring-hydroxylating dioxygenase large terminal subunit
VNGYPAREAGGMVWAFFGTGAVPKFPDFEYCHLPADHVHVRVAFLPVNWMQAMEAIIDSAHLGILHSSSVQLAFTESAKVQQTACTVNTWPRIKYTLTPYGFREAALRDQPDGTVDTRIREFVAPWHAFLPLNPGAYRQVVTTVPVDDVHCLQFFVIYMSQRPLNQKDVDLAWFSTHSDPNNIAVAYGTPETMWNQDRAAMKNGHFTGMTQRHVFYEDFAILESMGPITDRTKEYLCQTDGTVILARRQLMKSARAFARDGTPPWGLEQANDVDFSRIRGVATTLSKDDPWESVNAFAL